MQFGVCGDPDVASIASKCGYDFAEWTVGALLKPLEPEDAFAASLAKAAGAGLPYRALNCFLPADHKVTGPDADMRKLRKFAETVFERASRAGIETIVFGSGGARRIPDGFDRDAANAQLVEFCSMIGPLAAARGVTVVIEPLNKTECNVLTSVAECAALVHKVAHPSVRLLADAYHMMLDNDPFEDIVANAKLLAHTHLATVPRRLAPGAESCDLAGFFAALVKAGYKGRVSIEARLQDPKTELPAALAHMKMLAAGAA